MRSYVPNVRSRYEDDGPDDDGDYINCPFYRAEYERFATELAAAQQIPLRYFEAADARFF